MKTTIAAYGFLELREMYRKYALEGLFVAGLIHMVLIAGYQWYLKYTNENIEFPNTVLPHKSIVLPPPPPIGNSFTAPKISIATSQSVHTGIPIPFPDAIISPEATIPNQNEMNTSTGMETIGTENGITSTGEEHFELSDENPPPAFVPVAKPPLVITKVSPVYPDIPRRSGIEGIVHVKMWVTKEGKVKKAYVVKSTSVLFDEAAVEAATHWTFTPALTNNGPVSIWVTVPFRFRLQ